MLCADLLCDMCCPVQVVVYMQPQLSQPIRVYLSAQPGSANLRMYPEVVEAGSTLANIQDLLAQRQLTCTDFPLHNNQTDQGLTSISAQGSARNSSSSAGGSAQGCIGSSSGQGVAAGSSNVVVKRQNGSCCSKVRVEEDCSIQELLEAIWEVEVSQLQPFEHQFSQVPSDAGVA